MKEFSCFCKDVEEKLDRGLSEKELEFLEWLYGRHTEEIKIKRNP